MKKMILGLVLLFVFAFALDLKASCNGNSYNVTSWDNVIAEFTYHCCGGDNITVTNVLTGEIRNLQMPQSIHGDGSSCA
jgi:hypothetical protein